MDSLGYTLMVAIFGSIALFLLGRMAVLWYWRIDDIVALLTSIDESLKQLPAVRRHEYAQSRSEHAA